MVIPEVRTSSTQDFAGAHAAVAALYAAIDRGRAASALPLLTEDIHFETSDAVLRGHNEIRTFLSNREAQRARHTVHVIANETFEEASADEVHLSAFMLLYVYYPDVGYAVDRILDTVHCVRRIDHRWYISHRTSHALHQPNQIRQ